MAAEAAKFASSPGDPAAQLLRRRAGRAGEEVVAADMAEEDALLLREMPLQRLGEEADGTVPDATAGPGKGTAAPWLPDAAAVRRSRRRTGLSGAGRGFALAGRARRRSPGAFGALAKPLRGFARS
ncbi:hypothetical protein [Siccirubricoccus phaeus]|uniref:hypothetical protein n=1 Tax=Siccirubricoccus phaeus TaxID=2595053 RepID=UPI0011F15C14|nr:hypothetical protein [Siccirubricoccus phaeus]